MKRSLLLILFLPVVLMLVLGLVYQETLLGNIQWLFAAVATVLVWLLLVGLFAYINQQVDDNPYYTQMVLKKRDEVRLRQKIYAESLNAKAG